MIEMTARIPLDTEVISRGDLLAFAEQVRTHPDVVISLDYADDSVATVAPVALEAYWEVTGDDSQQ